MDTLKVFAEKLKHNTKRFVILECVLAALIISTFTLRSVGRSFRSGRLHEQERKLKDLPDVLSDWRVCQQAKPAEVDERGYIDTWKRILRRTYMDDKSGKMAVLDITYWIDPVRCYETHGWQVDSLGILTVSDSQPAPPGNEKVSVAQFSKADQVVTMFFWEMSLIEPSARGVSSLLSGTDSARRFVQLFHRVKRRVQEFFRRGYIVVKVVYQGAVPTPEEREPLIRLTKATLKEVPKVLE